MGKLPGAVRLGGLVSLFLCGAAQAGCLSADTEVTLEGRVLEGLFAGPPEFTSVARGDEPHMAQFLYLSEPICVAADADLEMEAVAAVELMQLACDRTPLPMGEFVEVTGRLFPAHTGYHHTRVLLQCN